MSDPKRLLDELGDGELRSMLDAGKHERPDAHQMAALAAKIGLLGGLGGAGAAGAGSAGMGGAAGTGASGAGASAGAKAGASAVAAAAKGGLAAKVIGTIAVAGAVGAGTVAVTRQISTEEPRPVGIVIAPTPSAVARPDAEDNRLAPFAAPLASAFVEPSARKAAPPAPTAGKTAAPDPAGEVKLLERAQDALKTRPDEALALCDEHARLYAAGMLAQEREVIAIEALIKAGRRDQARARAARFKTRWPGSSHTRRVDTLLSP